MSSRLEGALMSGLGAGFLLLGWLCQTERLPRNDVVGMRTGATLASDAAWYAAHRASAWSVALAGLLFLAAGLWLLRADQSARSKRTVAIGTVVAVVITVVIGGVQADRVAKSSASAVSVSTSG